jgi:hypothetical protein
VKTLLVSFGAFLVTKTSRARIYGIMHFMSRVRKHQTRKILGRGGVFMVEGGDLVYVQAGAGHIRVASTNVSMASKQKWNSLKSCTKEEGSEEGEDTRWVKPIYTFSYGKIKIFFCVLVNYYC